MATFNSFANVLPDPYSPITDAGDTNASGTQGPGFAGITVTSNKDTQVSRTISGRGVHRESGSHYWEIDIKYNPMLREQFDPVDAFLESRNSRLTPFYILLPQYIKPKNLTFANFCFTHGFTTGVSYLAGASNMTIGTNVPVQGNARPGDMFTINDPANINHQKVYKVTRAETTAYYQAGSVQPASTQQRIWFNPPLQRMVTAPSTINFINPLFRVITKTDVKSYDLNTDNLYSFSLSLEEVQA